MKLPVSLWILLHALVTCDAKDIDITVPSIVQAGTPFNATLTSDGNARQKPYYAYALRVYLASSVQEEQYLPDYNSECYLIHEQSICDPTISLNRDSSHFAFNNTMFTVTIPASVGPSGKYYALAARVMNTDGSYYTMQLYSDVFELTGANGTWAKIQQQGETLWGDDGISCTGFSCVKDCSDALGTAPNMTIYDSCINSCPGVSVDPNSTRGGAATAALVEASACPSVSTTSSFFQSTNTGAASSGSVSQTATATAQSGAATSRSGRNVWALIACLSPVLFMLRA